MSAPVNDLCANAIVIGALPYATVIDTTEATDDPAFPDTDCGSGNSYNGVWYTYTVPVGTTRLKITLSDHPDFEGVYTIFKGPNCGALVYTNICGSSTAADFFTVAPGDVLYFLLTSFDPGGVAALNFGLIHPEPTGDFCKTLVCEGISAACPVLDSVFINTPYNDAVNASGGTPPYTFTVTGGALPPGLSLNAATGAITGVPSLVGTYDFTITITDSAANETVIMCEIIVIPQSIDTVSPCPIWSLLGLDIAYQVLPGLQRGDPDE